MKRLLYKTREVLAYVLHRRGFFTKKLVVGSVTLLLMLFLDIRCHIWDGMGLTLLVLLTLYVSASYMMRYIEMKKEDEEKMRDMGILDEANMGEGTLDGHEESLADNSRKSSSVK